MALSRKKIVSVLLLLVLLISIPVGIYLARQTQTTRGRAAENTQDRDRSKIKKVGAYFFYWYDFPNNPGSDPLAYLPYGFTPGEGTNYSATSLDWYKQQLKDMEYAGIDYIFPISMGQVPQTGNRGFVYLKGDPFGDPVHRYMPHSSLLNSSNAEEGNLVKAIRQNQSKMKVGLFDDMTSLSLENNDLADDGQINGSNYCGGADWFNNRVRVGDSYQYQNPCKIQNILLPSDSAFNSQYTRKIKDFFQGIPRDLWATHNGLSVEQGGRPIVMFYPPITPISFQGPPILGEQGLKKYAIKAHFKRMKDAFRNDFGVEPFFISNYWGDLNDPEFVGIFDSHIGWMAVLGGIRTKNDRTGYVAGAISPGQNGERLDENWQRLKNFYNIGNIYSYQPRTKPVCKDPTKESDRQYINPGAPLDLNNPNHVNRSCHDFPESSLDTHLKDSFNLVTNIYGPDPGKSIDLLIVETWNELIEGTGIMRAKNWPRVDSPGNREFSPSNKSDDTVLMTSLRSLLGFAPTNPPELIAPPIPSSAPVVTPTPSPSAPGNSAPFGYFDGVDNNSCTVFGWAADNDTTSSIKVHAYKDGPVGGGGTWLAEISADDPKGVGEVIPANARFNNSLPAEMNDGREHQIYLYAIDPLPNRPFALLNGSPQTIRCSLPATVLQSILSLFGSSGNTSQGDQNNDGKINELDFGAVYAR